MELCLLNRLNYLIDIIEVFSQERPFWIKPFIASKPLRRPLFVQLVTHSSLLCYGENFDHHRKMHKRISITGYIKSYNFKVSECYFLSTNRCSPNQLIKSLRVRNKI